MKPINNISLEHILDLYRHRGQAQYGGEAVSQLEHALQCATFAEAEGASAELIAACLLHDLGHLVHHLGDNPALQGIDDRHEYRAAAVLAPLFPDSVTTPIRLHVAAKRYLCQVDSTYWESLSPASKLSLELQGGIFSASMANSFITQPNAQAAVKLRRWDDAAKVENLNTPNLEHFQPILEAVRQVNLA
ncbi:MAG: phosphonate degradation HD-domain oxygenase [Cyanobacteria bacterium P01_H01_bin.152]